MTSSRLFEYNQQYNAQNDDDTMPNAQNRGRLQWQRYAHMCMIFSESVLDIGDDDDHDDGIDDDDGDSIDDDDDEGIDDDDDGHWQIAWLKIESWLEGSMGRRRNGDGKTDR